MILIDPGEYANVWVCRQYADKIGIVYSEVKYFNWPRHLGSFKLHTRVDGTKFIMHFNRRHTVVKAEEGELPKYWKGPAYKVISQP